MVNPVPIDRSLWSHSSQRSSGGEYDAAATHYEGIRFRCRACEASCVFTAEEQRIAYEEHKKFVSWLPSLCAACGTELTGLQSRAQLYQAQWNSAREAMATDKSFLESWLAVLQSLRAHGKANESMEHMLLRRLREHPGESEPSNAA